MNSKICCTIISHLYLWYSVCKNSASVNLSRRVWIIFGSSFKIFFWLYMLSVYLPLQIHLSKVFNKKPSIWFVILVAGLRNVSPRPRYSEQVCSIFSGPLFSFLEKCAQGLTQSCWQDAYGLYFWHLQCLCDCRLWKAVFTVLRSGKDGRYGFEKRRLFLVCHLGWFGSVKRQN